MASLNFNKFRVWILDNFSFIRFAIVGGGATLIHLVTAATIISYLTLSPLKANLIAFLLAFVFSFLGHYYWSFNSSRNIFSSVFRFIIIALLGFLINNIILVLLLADGYLTELESIFISAMFVPFFTYLLARIWVFSKGEI